jgi:hypothetical protein
VGGVRFAQVCEKLEYGYLAVALQWVAQFVDKCIDDCREELRFEHDSSLAM